MPRKSTRRAAPKKKRGPAKPKPAKVEATPPPAQKYYDSIASAAAHLEIAPALLRKAKKLGAPGFQGSRVYPEQLLPWLKQHNPSNTADQKEQLDLRRLRNRIEREEFEFAKEKKEWVPKSELLPDLNKLATDVQSMLRQKLENEYPSSVTSMEPAQARIYGKRLVDSIYREFARFADKWSW